MTTNWNSTSDLVADRRAARESAAQRHRLLSKTRRGHHFFHRRHADLELASAPVTANTTAPTTRPTPERAAA